MTQTLTSWQSEATPLFLPLNLQQVTQYNSTKDSLFNTQTFLKYQRIMACEGGRLEQVGEVRPWKDRDDYHRCSLAPTVAPVNTAAAGVRLHPSH